MWKHCSCLPFNFGPDDINNLVGQAHNALVAEVNGDSGLLLLQFSGSLCCICGSLRDVVSGLRNGGPRESHHLVVRDGRRDVVAHRERAEESVEAAAERTDWPSFMVVSWAGGGGQKAQQTVQSKGINLHSLQAQGAAC